MTVDPDTLSRRVLAARAVAGYEKQKELGELMAADGHGLHDVGKWERADPTAPPMSPARARSMSAHTGVPPEWFTEPDLARVFVIQDEAHRTRNGVERLAQAIKEKLEDPESPALDDLIQQLRANDPRPPEEPGEDEGPEHD